MRKFALVFLALFACLLCGWDGGVVAAQPITPSGSCLVLDRSASEQWVCEREFNSDLALPRIAAEAAPATLTPPSLRNGQCFQRMGVKCGFTCGGEGGAVRANSEFTSLSIAAGPCAIDYYVYRLRRLII